MIVIVYFQFYYELRYNNEIINNEMMGSIIRNDVNNYIIYFNKIVVQFVDNGIFCFLVRNIFGEIEVYINMLF